jgi:hypothetical protein
MIPARALLSLLALTHTKTPIHQPTLAVSLLPLRLDSTVCHDRSCASNEQACLRLRDSTFSIPTNIIINIIGVSIFLFGDMDGARGWATEHRSLGPGDYFLEWQAHEFERSLFFFAFTTSDVALHVRLLLSRFCSAI